MKNKKFWLVTVNMGYGHLRAVYPLRKYAEEQVIVANSYAGIPDLDKQLWQGSRKFYERISRFKHIPVVGDWVFSLFDKSQEIQRYYPERDLSGPNLQVSINDYLVRRKKFGQHLIDKLNQKLEVPLVTAFPIIAFMADLLGFRGEIFCLATDTDISRAWVAKEPKKSRIKYLAPTRRVKDRLQEYGVSKDKIFVTGFPLPQENIGASSSTLKMVLAERLNKLDPSRNYWKKYEAVIQKALNIKKLPSKSCQPLTIAFAVGGAGAQREIASEIVASLKKKIKQGEIKIVLIAGSRPEIRDYFYGVCVGQKLRPRLQFEIIYDLDKNNYFAKFNQALNHIDVLWTKPSELSFYAGLGLPILMAPPIGSQEDFNREWLLKLGAGVDALYPKYTNQWLFKWLDRGFLAEMAFEGYQEAGHKGTENILKIVL